MDVVGVEGTDERMSFEEIDLDHLVVAGEQPPQVAQAPNAPARGGLRCLLKRIDRMLLGQADQAL